MISWPAIIKYEGEDELTYVSSQSEWDCDTDLHFFSYAPEDALIDSSGQMFGLSKKNENLVNPISLNKSLELEELVELAQKHLSSIGECCSAKMHFSSIPETIANIGECGD